MNICNRNGTQTSRMDGRECAKMIDLVRFYLIRCSYATNRIQNPWKTSSYDGIPMPLLHGLPSRVSYMLSSWIGSVSAPDSSSLELPLVSASGDTNRLAHDEFSSVGIGNGRADPGPTPTRICMSSQNAIINVTRRPPRYPFPGTTPCKHLPSNATNRRGLGWANHPREATLTSVKF